MKKVFEKLGKVVEMYINNHIEEWYLGGPGKILIVDEFPGGYMTETLINSPVPKRRNNNNCHTILCIAEVELDQIPPRMWMHIIEANPGVKKLHISCFITYKKFEFIFFLNIV